MEVNAAVVDRVDGENDRDERRVLALRATLLGFVEASRRAAESSSVDDQATAALEAQALRHVAWTVIADDDEAGDPPRLG